MIRTATIFCALAALALTWAGDAPAQAQTITGTFSVSVGVNVACSIAPSSVMFPSAYAPSSSTPLDGFGAVQITCASGAVTRLRVGQGQNPAPGSTDTTPLRRMTDGTSTLDYNLYEDVARTIVWSNRLPGKRVDGPYPVVVPLYARIDPGQPITGGFYSDAVVIVVIY